MKSSLLILSLIFCSALSGQKGNSNICRWHSNAGTTMADYNTIKRTGLSYSLSNDNDNIYLDIKVADAEEQNMILRNGLVIWINMDGKKDRKLGVRYPVGSRNITTHRGDDSQSGDRAQQALRGNPLTMANTIELIGFINETQRRFPSENPDNFRASVKFDAEGALVYNMLMPLVKLPLRNTKNGSGSVPFTLGIEYGFSSEQVNPMEKADRTSSPSNKAGTYSSGSAKGKRPGKGSHTEKGGKIASQGSGTNAKNQQTATGSELFWIKEVRLASSR
jgi:hypothetical protein